MRMPVKYLGESSLPAPSSHMAGWWEEWFQMDTKHRQSQENEWLKNRHLLMQRNLPPIRPVVHIGTMVDAFTWLDSGFVFYKCKYSEIILHFGQIDNAVNWGLYFVRERRTRGLCSPGIFIVSSTVVINVKESGKSCVL